MYTKVLALCLLASAANAAIHCYECPEGGIQGALVDCRNPESNYLGEPKVCSKANGYNEELCLKRSGKKEDFTGLPNSANYEKMVFRGCVKESETSPWDNGWEEKNRCKTKDGITTCTCKDDEMCNGVEGHAAMLGALALAALSTLLI